MNRHLTPTLPNTPVMLPGAAGTGVILLEGRRRISAPEARRATEVGRALASAWPEARFRSGNADGADEAFARGVAEIDATRLELVVPSRGHGKNRRPAGARVVTLGDLAGEARLDLVGPSIAATPGNRRLLERWVQGARDRGSASGGYLARDTLKVLGSPGLLEPAAFAVFCVDAGDPEAGGTGHTIRVCRQAGVAVAYLHQFA